MFTVADTCASAPAACASNISSLFYVKIQNYLQIVTAVTDKDIMEEHILPEDDSVFLELVDELDHDVSVRSTSLMEDSFSSCIGEEAVTSTPVRSRGRGRGTGRGATRGQVRSADASSGAGAGKKQTSSRLPCPQCSNTYANERTLAVHMKMHAMKSISARAPTIQDFEVMVQQLLPDVFNDIKQEVDFSDMSKSLHVLCSSVEENLSTSDGMSFIKYLAAQFHKILQSQNPLLPSALRSSVYIKTNHLLSSPDYTTNFIQALLKIKDCTEETANLFIGNVTLKLSNKILVNYLRQLRGAHGSALEEVRQKRSTDQADSEELSQVVYYIGGSIVSGFLKKGQHSTSSSWKVYVDLLRCKFLSGSVPCSTSVSAFTEEKDRGGLKYLNQEAYEFFSIVFDILMSLEGSDGSLPHTVVDDKVTGNEAVLCVWDDLVGSELTEEQSIDLLIKTVHCCARVVAKGIMKRRLNEELKQAFSSVALRSRLAR